MRFIPGLRLCERFYHDLVRPILDARFPGIPHSAAHVGNGSEILGYDDSMSTDHHWGPSLELFLLETDREHRAAEIEQVLATCLPRVCQGYSTHFSEPAPDDQVQVLQAADAGPVRHRVTILTIREFVQRQLGVDPEVDIAPSDWLSFSEQRLLSVTAGAVYHDDLGLESVRSRFAYYPHDIWLYLMAAEWHRIGQEEHLMGRAGVVGDELGSAIIGARLVRDLMHLCFLVERRYAPYFKWFGTAFMQLRSARAMRQPLLGVLASRTWHEREEYLVQAYEIAARLHNGLGLTDPMPEQVRTFHGRPFKVIAMHGFDQKLLALIRDPAVCKIAEPPILGSIEQWSDSTDVLSNPTLIHRVRGLYS